MKPKQKQKVCPICGEKFTPFNSLTVVCSPECAYKSVKNKTGKSKISRSKRMADKETRNRLKTRGEWLKEAQTTFNSYIRARDKDKPCISCGCTNTPLWDAGHFRGRKAHPALRFDEMNVHKQCRHCNSFLSGRLDDYRINLVKKIGIKEVERLEGKQEPLKLSIEDIKQIKKLYQLKRKEVER